MGSPDVHAAREPPQLGFGAYVGGDKVLEGLDWCMCEGAYLPVPQPMMAIAMMTAAANSLEGTAIPFFCQFALRSGVAGTSLVVNSAYN